MNATLATDIPAEILADMEAVAAAVSEGKKPASDVVRRVRQRSIVARKEVLAVHGVQDIGVAIIRELRGELPA